MVMYDAGCHGTSCVIEARQRLVAGGGHEEDSNLPAFLNWLSTRGRDDCRSLLGPIGSETVVTEVITTLYKIVKKAAPDMRPFYGPVFEAAVLYLRPAAPKSRPFFGPVSGTALCTTWGRFCGAMGAKILRFACQVLL